MKVCKFEKMKEEDEIRQVINYTLKEHPYVVVVPTLTQLQEWLQDISISWFHEEDSSSHATINNIEEYCRTRRSPHNRFATKYGYKEIYPGMYRKDAQTGGGQSRFIN